MDAVLDRLDEINKKFDALSRDVDDLKTTRDRSRSPVRVIPPTPDVVRQPTLWADRDPNEVVDYNTPVHFSDDEETEDFGSNLVEVSEQTSKLLKTSCTRSVSNEVRKRTRSAFNLPRVPATRTPRLDQFLRSEIPQPVKSLDKELSRLQSFVLDALAPLTALVETSEQEVTPEQMRLATTSAISLIGNASAQISRLRREKVVSGLNKALLPLAKDDASFSDAPPELFGPEFAKRSKEFLEQVRTIRSSLPSKPHSAEHRNSGGRQHYQNSLFRRGQSSGRTGAYRRGGASTQFNRRNQGGNRPAKN